ncbi:MAG: site-2 protease family protein [Atopobiaceae bacterium]|nr:site-2 protease family protein [Atopobiaceae bacterium]
MGGFFSALFWGLLVLSLLVVIHEAGHFLLARLFRVRVTEFFLGMPFKYRLAVRSQKNGTLFGVTPLLLGGYNRICGMSGMEDERLASVLGYVTRKGRVEVQTMADDLGMELEDAYELLSTLEDWASVEAYYDPELGEFDSQADWPRSFQTPARDGACRTIYDLGYDASLPGSIETGEA